MPDTVDCIVIGAGKSGLAAADARHRQGLKVTIIEASDTVGGLGSEPVSSVAHFRRLIDPIGTSAGR